MDNMEFRRDPEAPVRAALMLKRLHGIGRTSMSRCDPFAPIDVIVDRPRGLRFLGKLDPSSTSTGGRRRDGRSGILEPLDLGI
jgi:hypothetical protein